MKLTEINKDHQKLEFLVNQLAKYQEEFEDLGGYKMQSEVAKILPKLGFSDSDAKAS